MNINIEVKKRKVQELVKDVNEEVRKKIVELEELKKNLQDGTKDLDVEQDDTEIEYLIQDAEEYLEFALFHKRYSFPNTLGLNPNDFSSFDEMEKEVAKRCVVYSKIHLLDHSGLQFSTSSFNDPWDSGCLGFIGITKEAVKKIHGKYTKALAKKVFNDTLDNWIKAMQGEIYLVGIKDLDIWISADDPYDKKVIEKVVEEIDVKIAELKDSLVEER